LAKQKHLTPQEALSKLQRYCAYQERSHNEVRSKLIELGVYGDELENVMVALIEGNFLNEERFACTFARGKFNMKQWGRRRIIQELKRHRISEYCIKKAMEEIDEASYLITLRELLRKKLESLPKGEPPLAQRAKLMRYAFQKGYEGEAIEAILGE
jgi:regulatory protein